jgi:uncharacterized membrane protein
MTSRLFIIGIMLILLGFFLLAAGLFLGAKEGGFGGLILIGPIPIGFGSSAEITLVAMVIGLLIMIIYLLLGRQRL